MAGTSPTQRSLANIRERGYVPWVVIELTKGYQTTVDAGETARVLEGLTWVASEAGGKVYAVRGRGKGRQYLHRLIAGAGAGEYVDHIDGDTLNNTSANLRICTKQQNHFNSRKRNPKSGFKGVSQHKDGIRWVARLTINGKNLYLGTFTKAEDAAAAYDEAARKHHGEFARGNFQ